MSAFRLFCICCWIACVPLLLGCQKGGRNENGQREFYSSYPYVPDTDALPELTLAWERPLLSSVAWVGTYGVWEGSGNHVEIAAELELHFDRSDEAIYALADGIVVYVQVVANHGDPVLPNEVEGVWIRYGRNFMLKYVHVGYPLVREGDTVRKGQRIGSTSLYGNYGFWEVESQVRIGSRQYTDCLYKYLDTNTKAAFDELIQDARIQQASGIDPQVPVTWCHGERIDATATDRPGIW